MCKWITGQVALIYGTLILDGEFQEPPNFNRNLNLHSITSCSKNDPRRVIACWGTISWPLWDLWCHASQARSHLIKWRDYSWPHYYVCVVEQSSRDHRAIVMAWSGATSQHMSKWPSVCRDYDILSRTPVQHCGGTGFLWETCPTDMTTNEPLRTQFEISRGEDPWSGIARKEQTFILLRLWLNCDLKSQHLLCHFPRSSIQRRKIRTTRGKSNRGH